MCFTPRAYLRHTRIPSSNNMNYISGWLECLSNFCRPGALN
jgi:hypothetical protein